MQYVGRFLIQNVQATFNRDEKLLEVAVAFYLLF